MSSSVSMVRIDLPAADVDPPVTPLVSSSPDIIAAHPPLSKMQSLSNRAASHLRTLHEAVAVAATSFSSPSPSPDSDPEYDSRMEKFAHQNSAALELTWQDITVSSKRDANRKMVKHVTGAVKGKFLAIMGPSGSGKTTLMNVLACRMSSRDSTMQGAAFLNGLKYSSRDLKRVSGYVMQDDLLNGHLTVLETLTYSAELRLDPSLSPEARQARVFSVLEELNLLHCKDVVIGDSSKKGISGGERKRLCVGLELITDPQLLFLDEPTSGLDSVTALALCSTLSELVKKGRCTIICTIHQPQSKIFSLFDSLVLLARGRVVYNGPTAEVPLWLSEAGYPCPPLTNVADHMLDVIQGNVSVSSNSGIDGALENPYLTIHSSTKKRGEELEHDQDTIIEKLILQQSHMRQSSSDDALSSKYNKTDNGEIAHSSLKVKPENNMKQEREGDSYVPRTSWSHQFRVLFRRSFREQVRNRSVIITQVIQSVIMAVLIGTVFLQIGVSQSSIVRRGPVVFFCAVNQGMFGSLHMINTFPSERALVLRERAAGTYYVSAYFLAKQLVESLMQLICPILFSCIVYFLIGLQESAAKFFIFLLFMILCTFAANSLALMISAFARTTSLSCTILPMALEMCRLFGAFFLSPANTPAHFKWLQHLSYVQYTYVGTLLNELTGLQLTCTATEIQKGTCINRGEITISTLGLDELTIQKCIGILIAYIVILRALAYIGMRYLKH